MRIRRLWAALLISCLLPTSTAMAAPAITAPAGFRGEPISERAIQTLKHYKVVEGNEHGDLMLDQPITRAETIKVLIAALGKHNDAQMRSSEQPFTDVAGHWGAGWIAVAKGMGVTAGYPDGSFQPDKPISYAEVLTLLVRQVGLQPTSGEWPMNYVEVAKAAGIATAELQAYLSDLNAPAIRNVVFALAHNAFHSVRDRLGQNFYMFYIDRQSPELRVDTVPTETDESSVLIRGRVLAETWQVRVREHIIYPAGHEGTWNFAAEVQLQEGANEIPVVAEDLAGNITTVNLTITRTTAPTVAVAVVEPTHDTTLFGEGVYQSFTAKVDGDYEAVGVVEVTLHRPADGKTYTFMLSDEWVEGPDRWGAMISRDQVEAIFPPDGTQQLIAEVVVRDRFHKILTTTEISLNTK